MTSFSILFCKDCDTRYYLVKCSDCKNFFCNACYWKCNICNENPNEIVDEVDLEAGQLSYRDVYEDEDIEEHENENSNGNENANGYSLNLFSDIMNSFNLIAREILNPNNDAVDFDDEIDIV